MIGAFLGISTWNGLGITARQPGREGAAAQRVSYHMIGSHRQTGDLVGTLIVDRFNVEKIIRICIEGHHP